MNIFKCKVRKIRLLWFDRVAKEKIYSRVLNAVKMRLDQASEIQRARDNR